MKSSKMSGMRVLFCEISCLPSTTLYTFAASGSSDAREPLNAPRMTSGLRILIISIVIESYMKLVHKYLGGGQP